MDCGTALTYLDSLIAVIGLMFIVLAAVEYTRLAKLRNEFHEFENRLKRDHFNNQKALQRVMASYDIADVDRKIDLLETAIQIDPAVFNGYNSLGYAYLQKHDLFSAIDSFNKAIMHHPDTKEGYIDLAKAYIHAKNLHLARANLAKAISIDPTAKIEIENDAEIKAVFNQTKF